MIAVAGSGALMSCGQTHTDERAHLAPIKVQVAEAQLQRMPEIYEAMGTVCPRLKATVAAKVTAAIEEVSVKPGDTVHAGDPLARLDDRELRAEFDRAKADYERYQTLLRQDAVPRSQFDAVRSRYLVAEAALSYAKLLAPFEGIVVEKFCEVGDLAAPGRPLFSVERAGDFRLEAQVPERFVSALELGKSVDVIWGAAEEKCAGKIGEIILAADPNSRSFLVKIDLQCRVPLRSGTFGRARLPVGERSGILLPQTLLRERGQLTYLLVAQDGRAALRLVKIGRANGDVVEVLSGLQAGEQVITRAEAELVDGQPIMFP
jgi:RND family efflux transporter MFP subunit